MEIRAVNRTGAITIRSLRFDIPGMNFRLVFGSLGMLHLDASRASVAEW